jgi:PAS domain-containing protein
MLPSADRHRVTTIAQLRTRAARLRRTNMPADLDDLIDQVFTLCDAMLQDLAGQRFDCEAVVAKLKGDASQSAHASALLFDEMPVACLETDANGIIVRANRAAALLLNLSARFLNGRLLRLFSQRRDEFDGFIRTLGRGRMRHRVSMALWPRERAPFRAELTVVPIEADSSSNWLWFMGTDHRDDASPRRSHTASHPEAPATVSPDEMILAGRRTG